MAYKRRSPQPVIEGGTSLSTITAHNLIAGNGTGTPNLVAPSATTGVPLISQGSSADPVYGTALVPGGGTGLTSITAHDLIVGNGTSTPNLLAPSATSGVPIISQGSSADPVYGTAVVAGGGTGATSFTAYAPICGGTTTTGALQSASTGISTSGFVLTSNGASALPSFQAASGGASVIFFANATANQTVTAQATVVFDNTVINVGSGYNSGTNTFTAPSTGTYFISAAVIVIGHLADAVVLQKNGSGQLLYCNNVQVSAPAYYMTVPFSVIVSLTAADTLKVIYTWGSSTNATINGQATYVTYFMGYKIA